MFNERRKRLEDELAVVEIKISDLIRQKGWEKGTRMADEAGLSKQAKRIEKELDMMNHHGR